ncbi:hypothetical protein [Castellaniella sp.]|uniref:hypothetical protein n=1 Tax=Castellaniella sp. TaxID=1955812 RepID=UPI002AFF2417|nr:hypothetical protein [Castellaniella sp.]
MIRLLSGWPASLLAAALCLGGAIVWHDALTALMSLHMLVQIPLLVAGGVFAEQAWRGGRPARAQAPPAQADASGQSSRLWQATSGRGIRWSYNAYGMPGLLLVSLVGAGWMIPKALDDALVDWRVATFKYLGLPLCGWLLQASVRQANVVIKLFFLGNFCWMSAIVGMVYLDQPIRLCNAYLQDDQDWAGRGLIALAIVLPSCWLLAAVKPVWRFLNR